MAPNSELVCAVPAWAGVGMFMWMCPEIGRGSCEATVSVMAGGQSSGMRGPAVSASGSREVSHGFLVHIASPKRSSALSYGTLNRLHLRTNCFNRHHKLSYVWQLVELQKI